MQYALLIYAPPEAVNREPITEPVAGLLARPEVTGWARLHEEGSATTVRTGDTGMLVTDGPFIDSKEFIAGLIFVEADDLDGALAIAGELQEGRTGGIEVRPVFQARFAGA